MVRGGLPRQRFARRETIPVILDRASVDDAELPEHGDDAVIVGAERISHPAHWVAD